ncbi:hypothetical protein CTAYLR_009234 [Chrysophaeum taylorii]|uniref:non-specific serine/threonine protein kinase n=1 Tax=Chrysophaeum taylorii TaxID=2483200 RepID=A0AAD7UGD8_9STRA|nr:hypothetical protein CTAYLR_009234 [Chrysophaeum taylorii]
MISLENYGVEGPLGRGAFGRVCRVRRKTDGAAFACKSVVYAGMSQAHKKQLVAEVNIMRELNQKHIVRYVDRSIDRSTGTLHIIMELCSGGDLASLLASCRRKRQSLPEFRVLRLAGEAATALRDCHGGHLGGVILHRDLKPANILFDEFGSCKLADFGLAKELSSDDLAKTNLGTPLYMAPELVKRKPYGPPADMWSLGCILHEAATLEPPFDARDQESLSAAITAGVRNKPISKSYSADFRSLVDDLLRLRPQDRATAARLLRRPSLAPWSDAAEPATNEQHPKSSQQHARKDPTPDRAKLLDEREKKLDDREKKLDAREKDLDARQRDLILREARLRPSKRRPQDELPLKDLNDMKKLKPAW